MNDQDRQLVDLITQQVLAVLAQRGLLRDQGGAAGPVGGAGQPGAATPSPHSAPIQPPIGVCTGDYSKFPELAGRLYGTSTTNPAPAPPPVTPMPAPPPSAANQPLALSGIVTANQLQQAMDAAPDGVAHLAPDARLTPLAADLARRHAKRICRVTPGAAASTPAAMRNVTQPAQANPPWLWWIDGQCAAVRQTTQQFLGWLRPIAAGPHSSAMPQVVRELASLLKSRQIAGAVLFVPNAARAMCYLNRCAAVRAVVGTCGEAVEQGISEIGANVLVIEYPHHGQRAMAAMVQRMLQQQPAAPPAVERELADLHRC